MKPETKPESTEIKPESEKDKKPETVTPSPPPPPAPKTRPSVAKHAYPVTGALKEEKTTKDNLHKIRSANAP